MRPPGRRSPGAADSRATATSGQQADEANTKSPIRVGQSQDAALFGVEVTNGAYGRTTTFDVPDHVRGPGPRTTTGPEDAAAPNYWWTEATAIVLIIATTNGTVTTDDLHDAYPDHPSASGAAFGGLFSRLAAAGLLVEVGMTKSRRPEARRRRIIVWAAP